MSIASIGLGLALTALAFAPPAHAFQDAEGGATGRNAVVALGGAAADPASDDEPAAVVDAGPQPTLAQIFRAPTLLGLRPSGVAISADGRFASYRWSDEAEEADATDASAEGDQHADAETPKRDLWLVDTHSGEARMLFTHDDQVELTWSRRGSLALIFQKGWYDLVDYGGDGARRPLFQAPEGGRLHFLRDGRTLLLSTRPDQQLWVIDLDTGARSTPAAQLADRSGWVDIDEDAERVAFWARPADDERPAVTDETDAGARDVAGHGRGTTAGDDASRLHLLKLGSLQVKALDVPRGGNIDVSPDGLHIAITRSERPDERDLIMADYLGEFVKAVPVRDSLAGDPAPTVTLALHDLDDGSGRPVPLDGAQRFSLRRSSWSPEGDWLLLDRVSEDSHVRELLLVDPFGQTVTPIFRERDEAWIGGPFLWSGWREATGEVLFTSERSGFNHLYALDPEGGEPRALTSGAFEVSSVQLLRDRDQALLVAHAPEDPAVTQLLLLPFDGGEPAALTGLSGCATRPEVSDDGSTVVYRWSTLGVPWDLHALDLDGDGGPRQLSHTVPPALAEQGFTPPEIVEFTNPDDGATVRAYLYRPEPFDPARRYPAVLFVHGAGYLQQVQRSMSSYEENMLFHQRLTRLGFAVIDADYRHSAGYGRDFRAAVHGFMGGKDLDDCVAAVDYLGTLGWVDTSRVGLYGGSYGGFLTLMALFTKPDVFACGAALRSVTDWRVYNGWYTTPRLGDPKKDAENYRRSSPIDHAAGLTKPLLLLHGLKDDNVFVQDTIRLMERLIELGKDFDAMLYPSQGHGFTDPDSWIDEYKRIERLMVEELKPGS